MDPHATLEQIEGAVWVEPEFDSYLVTTVHALRKKPIADFTVEDLRIMIGQQVGLKYLVPIALEHLERTPFVAGHFYRGDLLAAVIQVDRSYWQGSPADALRIAAIADRASRELEDLATGEVRTHLETLLKKQRNE